MADVDPRDRGHEIVVHEHMVDHREHVVGIGRAVLVEIPVRGVAVGHPRDELRRVDEFIAGRGVVIILEIVQHGRPRAAIGVGHWHVGVVVVDVAEHDRRVAAGDELAADDLASDRRLGHPLRVAADIGGVALEVHSQQGDFPTADREEGCCVPL